MNGTFMFGEDRFGPDEDYAATYHLLGGRALTPDRVRDAITMCCKTLQTIYDNPARWDSFPQVLETLRALPSTRGLPAHELALLERVIANHELGNVPDEYASALQHLARTHRLGVVANVWSRKAPYLDQLARAGVLNLFAITVFSSDGASMKPSRVLFERAVAALGMPRSDIVFVGDSLRHDIAGAAAASLATVWIDREGAGLPADGPRPDWIVRDLRNL